MKRLFENAMQKSIFLETSYGEFQDNRRAEPKDGFTVTSAVVDDDEKEGKNFVHMVNKEHIEQMKEFYAKAKDDKNWFILLLSEKKFPGHEEVGHFIENVLKPIKIFEGEWSKYMHFILVNKDESKDVFLLKLTVDEDMGADDFPIPFQMFRNLFLSVARQMPKVIYKYKPEAQAEPTMPIPKEEPKPEPKEQEKAEVAKNDTAKNDLVNAIKDKISNA